MKKIILTALLAMATLTGISAKEISAKKVSPKTVSDMVSDSLVDKKYFDEDGELILEKNGSSFYCQVRKNDNMLLFLTNFQNDKSVAITEAKAYEVCNQWNKENIFVQAYFANGAFTVCAYLPYDGGLKDETLNASIDDYFIMFNRFFQHIRGKEVY